MGAKNYDLPPFPREAELLNLLPYGKSWLWEASRKGEFPAPRKLSARTTVWVRDEVVEWLDARLAK